MTIWKKNIKKLDSANGLAEVPLDAKVLHAARQGQALCVWFETSGDCPQTKDLEFRVYATGEKFDSDPRYRHLSTLLLDGGAFVLHVYVGDQ